jgi:fatty-acid peroxygenase
LHYGTALYAVAQHRDANGDAMPPHIAAVEMINLLRPIVAVAWYIVFCALALHQNPQYRLKVHDEMYARMFVHVVRRFYPFFPAVAARVRENFAWQGYIFPKGIRVLLDLYGTNHHRELWDNPEEFRPERFFVWGGDPYTFIPQGGGDHASGHRCAGEWTTIALMQAATAFLAERIDYTVPEQDLKIDYTRMPARPNSGFIIARRGL